jgi:hypothetical protein
VVLVEVEREPCPLAALDFIVNPHPVLHSCGFINYVYIWKCNKSPITRKRAQIGPTFYTPSGSVFQGLVPITYAPVCNECGRRSKTRNTFYFSIMKFSINDKIVKYKLLNNIFNGSSNIISLIGLFVLYSPMNKGSKIYVLPELFVFLLFLGSC